MDCTALALQQICVASRLGMVDMPASSCRRVRLNDSTVEMQRREVMGVVCRSALRRVERAFDGVGQSGEVAESG